jgi:hypothetical protein
MTSRSTLFPGRRSFRVRLERAVLGLAMGIGAFVLERRILKAIKAGGERPREPEQQGLDELLNRGIRVSEP